MLALWIHTTGILAKLFSEAVEAIDPRPVEGIRATGASKVQEIIYGVIPQVLPLWISFSLYRFESNVRSATVVGIVGAGGIGRGAVGVHPRLLLRGDRRGDDRHHRHRQLARHPVAATAQDGVVTGKGRPKGLTGFKT